MPNAGWLRGAARGLGTPGNSLSLLRIPGGHSEINLRMAGNPLGAFATVGVADRNQKVLRV